MKTSFQTLKWALLMCAFGCSSAFALDTGDVAPPISASSASGSALSVSTSKAKLTYVDFWASWCGPCKQSFPWMNSLVDSYGDAGLRVVAINVDKKREDADKFLQKLPAKFELGFDPEGRTAAAYQVKAMPTSLLIDDKGKVLWIHQGFRPEEASQIETKIKHSLDSMRGKKS